MIKILEKENNKQSFMINVFIILFAQIAVKVLGMVYRLVITNVPGFGDNGNGFYSAGFQIYTLLLAVSSVGIPNAISKMTSEKCAVGDYEGAHKTFKTSLFLFAGIGVTCSLLLFVFSDFIAVRIIGMEGVKYTLKALSPSIMFVCISSVIHGYFLGFNDMRATSSSQIIEQFFKCTLTILIVYLLIGKAPEFMAAGANFATALATMISFTYLVLFYLKSRKKIYTRINASKVHANPLPVGTVVRNILMIAIPISLGSVITSIARIIDTATITRGIKIAFAAGLPGQAGLPTAQQLVDHAVRLAGQLSKSDTLTNLPLALNIAFATALVPTVSSAMAVGDKSEAADKISYSFLISILLILPCAVGYSVLARQIYLLLYPNASLGWELLILSSVSLIFMALNQTITGSLQGIGKVFVPAIGLLCGVVVKIFLNITLIKIPSINIYGAAFSTIVCHFIAFTISFIVLRRKIKLSLDFEKYFLKPVIAVAVMGVCAFLGYTLLFTLTHSNTLSLACAIVLGVLVYVVMVLVLRILNKNEIAMLPMGKKIVSVLDKWI